MVRVLAGIWDDLGRLKPTADTHRHVALDHWKHITKKTKACELGAMPMGIVETPSRLGCVAIGRIKERPNEGMIQPDAAIEQRDVSWVLRIGRLHKAFHRLAPFSLFLRRHPVEVVRKNGRGGQSFDYPEIANSFSQLIVCAMTDDDYVFWKLKLISFEDDPNTPRALKKLTSFISFKPYFPRVHLAVVGWELVIRTSP